MALLSLEGVSKRYRRGRREVLVLDDVWLRVDAGDHVAVWGERRAGKSTLLRLAAGIELPDEGIARFDGRSLAELSASERTCLLRDTIGFVAAPVGAWDENRRMRVLDYVAVPLLADGWTPGRDAAALARSALERVGVPHCGDLHPGELSLGERTRVAIARALIREPRLLLIDEPAATPSPSEQDEIRALLRSLAHGEDLTLVVASQEPAILRGAGRVVSVSDGRVLTSERPGTVLSLREAARRREPPRS